KPKVPSSRSCRAFDNLLPAFARPAQLIDAGPERIPVSLDVALFKSSDSVRRAQFTEASFQRVSLSVQCPRNLFGAAASLTHRCCSAGQPLDSINVLLSERRNPPCGMGGS